MISMVEVEPMDNEVKQHARKIMELLVDQVLKQLEKQGIKTEANMMANLHSAMLQFVMNFVNDWMSLSLDAYIKSRMNEAARRSLEKQPN